MAAGRGRSTSIVTGSVPRTEREPHPRRGAGEPEVLDQQRRGRRHGDAAEGEARRGDGEGERAACAEPARHQRGERHEAAGAVAEPEHDMEGIELPRLAQRPSGRQRQRADGSAAGDDDARVDALDQPARIWRRRCRWR